MQHWKHCITGIILSLPWAINCPANDALVLQLRWDHQFQFAGYYAAQWQGYYAEEGLEVEIRSALTGDGTILSAVEEVASGRADFGIGAADVLKANEPGPPLSVAATIFQQSAAAFYLKQDTPFRSLADLTRLRVARQVNSLIDVELQAMLLKEGIDPVNVPPHEHQAGLDHLLSDRIQVLPGYRTSTPYHTDEHGRPFREILPADYGVDFYGDSLFTRAELTQKAPELVEKFTRASLKGWQYALDHPEEMVVRISNELPRRAKLDDLEDFNRFQAQVVKELSLYPIVAIGNSNPDRWRRMHAFLKEIGQVEQELTLATFIFDPERLRLERQQRLEDMLLWLAVAVVLLLALAGLWTISLKRQVAQRTLSLQQELAERRQIERTLRTNEQLLRTIAENYPSYLSIIEADLTVGFTSGREFTKLGLNPDDFVGLPLEQIFREHADLVRSYYQQVFAGQEVTFELDINDQYQRYTAVPLYDEDGNIPQILAVVENITERKEAERALYELNRTLEAAQKMAKVGYWSYDIATQMPTWSEQMFVVCGYDPAGGVPAYEDHKKTWHPDDWEMFDAAVQACTKGTPYNIVIRIIFPDGSIHYVNTQGFPRYNERNEIMELFGTSQDITEIKQAEEELAKSVERFSVAVKIVDLIVAQVDCDLRYRWIYNPHPQFDPSTVLGKRDDELDWNEGIRRLTQLKQDILQSGKSKCEEITFELLTGRVIYDIVGEPLFDEAGQVIGVTTAALDITRRKEAEEQLKHYSTQLEKMVTERTRELQDAQEKLLRQEKLAALGQLAGSVAHELRHPLGVLSNATYFLKMSLPEVNEITSEYLEMISAEVQKSDKIISDLLDFSRNQLTEKHFRTATQLKELVDGVLEEHPPPDGVELETAFESDLPPVLVDPQQIKQVLTNLLLNAYQAMPDGGTLTVGSRQAAVGSEQSNRDSTLPTTDCLLLTVKDTGCGIAPEHLEKLFEPLFTTKPKGIGLGMAISKNLVEANGGRIEVESQEGQGSVFRMILPTADKMKEAQRE